MNEENRTISDIGKNRVYELLDNGDLKGFRIGRVWKIIKVIELYSKKAYGQGFGDCISVLQEIGIIRKL